MSVTVIIPARDEALHLRECLESVEWAERVVVVDSGSTDETVAIARSFPEVELVQHAYEGPADQKNWALEHLGIATEWVLFLDADERVTPDLASEIRRVTGPNGPLLDGWFVNRRIIWEGRWMRHGGWFPNWNLRLLRVGRGRYERRRVHEHVLCEGPTGRLRHHLVHEDRRGLSHQIRKHDRYSTDEAREYAALLAGSGDGYAKLFTRDPLARRRWVKTRLWARLPGKPLWYFLWAYFARLGFLDGLAGLRFHSMHAAFKLFDELKLFELRRKVAQPSYWSRHWGAPRQERGGEARPAAALPRRGKSLGQGSGEGIGGSRPGPASLLGTEAGPAGSSRPSANAEEDLELGSASAQGGAPSRRTTGGRS